MLVSTGRLSFRIYSRQCLPTATRISFYSNGISGKSDAPHFKQEDTQDHPFKDIVKTAAPKTDINAHQSSNQSYVLPHPIWNKEELNDVKVTHHKPQGFVDWSAYMTVQTMRFSFDVLSLYKIGTMDESKWLTRIIMLETVAGVPGMVGAMVRHLQSLRRMQRDYGWIHTLLEEAENERMHLLTALTLKQPGKIFRAGVLIIQGIMTNLLFVTYLISPRFCHRLVGYLEEEAVKTYTYCIKCIDEGKLPMWSNLDAPLIGKTYWNLPDDAKIRDLMLAIRADEAHHRVVNHKLSSMDCDEPNPFKPGE